MSNQADYKNYFRQMAISHKDLLHDPQAEEGLGDMQRKRFCSFSTEELVTSLRTQISFPALLLEDYENSFSAESVYDIRQRPRGAFMVIDHADPQNFPDIDRAYDVCEKIAFDILKKAWQDHYGPEIDRCETPFKQFRWNIEFKKTGMLFSGEYGWYVQFDFDFQNTINITEAPEEGTFL